VAIAPQDIISWLLTGARLESELSPHLQSRNIDADILYRMNIDYHPSAPGRIKRLVAIITVSTRRKRREVVEQTIDRLLSTSEKDARDLLVVRDPMREGRGLYLASAATLVSLAQCQLWFH
jgi:hypothetical protein